MEPKEKAVPQLAPNALQLFETISTRYDAQIGQGVEPEQLLEPAFWAHHNLKLRPFDEIRARAEDGTWIGLYVVLDSSRTWARVQQLALVRLSTRDVSLSQASQNKVAGFIEAHKIVYRGPHKWSVVRKTDSTVLTDGIEQKDDAQAWLEKHARTQFSAPAAVAEPA